MRGSPSLPLVLAVWSGNASPGREIRTGGVSPLMCNLLLNGLLNDHVMSRLPFPSLLLIFVLYLSHCHCSLAPHPLWGTSGASLEKGKSRVMEGSDGEK